MRPAPRSQSSPSADPPLPGGRDASRPPIVSVLITAYNAEATLKRALDSIFIQDLDDIEVIVVDDGSFDATSEIARQYGRPEIRLISLARNVGVCGALNHGLAAVQGRYVAFLDADDEWLPGKLRRQIDVMEKNPAAAFVSSGCVFVDTNGKLYREFSSRPPGLPKSEIWRALLSNTWVAKPTVVASSAHLRQVGGFDPKLAIAEDQDMWIRLALAGDAELLTDVLARVHDTPGSLTKIYASRTADYVLPMIKKHIAQNRDALSDDEVRTILGQRYSTVGRILYAHGAMLRGAATIGKAIGSGHRRGENLWHLLTAAPPVRALKRITGLGTTPIAPIDRETKKSGDVFDPSEASMAQLPPGPPRITVVVDTEAEFDWTQPFARDLTKVENVARQEPLQRLFERYGVKPAYMLDYAVASQPSGFGPIREYVDSGHCEVGAHLQPWENPPFAEELNEANSYAGNLPNWLHRDKLARLTEAIVANLGVQPIAHKAGRYGVGPGTASILHALGYRIDLSVLPGTSLRAQAGPDFTRCPTSPYWFGPQDRILEIPMTVAHVGALANFQRIVTPVIRHRLMSRLRAPGVFARLGLLERITLTPEGITIDELKRLTRSLLAAGQRCFTLSYHSSTLLPGSTRYVSNETELAAFVERVDQFLDFFIRELGGIPATPSEVLGLTLASRERMPPRPISGT